MLLWLVNTLVEPCRMAVAAWLPEGAAGSLFDCRCVPATLPPPTLLPPLLQTLTTGGISERRPPPCLSFSNGKLSAPLFLTTLTVFGPCLCSLNCPA